MISMKDYSNSKIYKIEPKCDYTEGDIYIGSTTQQYLCARMACHRTRYKKWKNGEGNTYNSYILFDKYGIDNCKMILIENVNVKTKDELTSREGFYIRSMQCINKVIPGRTMQEYKQKYYEENKEKLLQSMKEYREENKEKIKEYQADWRENNKEKKSLLDKQYRENNSEKIKERKKTKITCECGCIVNRDEIARHKRTIKHLDLLKIV